MKPSKYAIFAFDQYYPYGGWNDCKGIVATIEEARKVQKENSRYDYVTIVDLETGLYVD